MYHSSDGERLLEGSTNIHETGHEPLQIEDSHIHRSDTEHSRITRLLYVSHFLSTWNSRAFEFDAFLFLAAIYPQTLLPASVYALARAASAALLSPWIGTYIDRTDRLKVVRLSIGKQALRHLQLSTISDIS